MHWASVAQLDRASDFGSEGCRFESCPTRQFTSAYVIEWIIEGADFTKLDADAHVGRRAIALFWTLNPDCFEGVSLTALANRLGLHKAILSAQAAEARRKFGIKNRGQAHGWNFGKTAEPKAPQTRKGGALAEAAMSQLRARLAAMR